MEKEQENNYHKINLNWYPGHMAKSKKQIISDLKIVDLIVEVLDARAPKSSHNPDVDEYCKNKKRIVVLNKTDLADEKITDEWVEYFKGKNIVAVKTQANTSKNSNNLLSEIKIQGNSIRESYAKKGRTGYYIKVMIVGIPNVGKSTIINNISKRKSQKVENRPGVTQKNQWISIDDNIELLDTPGMFSPRFKNENTANVLSFLNTIGSNAVDNEEVAYNLLNFLINNYKENLENRYNITISQNENGEYDLEEVITEIAKKVGALLSGNKINEEKVSNIILRDFRTGKLGRISLEKPEKEELI